MNSAETIALWALLKLASSTTTFFFEFLDDFSDLVDFDDFDDFDEMRPLIDPKNDDDGSGGSFSRSAFSSGFRGLSSLWCPPTPTAWPVWASSSTTLAPTHWWGFPFLP